MTARIWLFDDNVNTDQVLPSQYVLLPTVEDMRAHTFEDTRPEFAACVKPGDIIVAGENFGCGSSREQAPRVLRSLGVSAVIAKGFARIFFRNCINIGLAALPCRDLSGIVDGDQGDLSLERGVLTVRGRDYELAALSPHVRMMIDAGGLIPSLDAEAD